jgi:3-hydroxyacyl-CoA dehydrogenase/enoyl-CoA hydratase/3-hydroxybutyryl-CoA epimerase/3-hydroxyacyl-CoA dehydrogenase/enoyl-CoA hydratase/3-hydroxybutyryl-CoA epimerase/enoyl-CoA isomerase
VAVLTLDDPNKGANILSRSVLDEFEHHLDALEKEKLAGLVIRSTKPGVFIAGADLREFVAELDAPKERVIAFSRRGHELFGRLAKASFVTVAAVDGVCLGGGAELALWCDRRIMTTNPKTQYGFPEVKLGLFPGWGGTARAPRIIGLSNAVEMIAGGDPVDALAAYRMSLANDMVPADELEQAAIRMIRAEQKSGDYKQDRRKWAGKLDIDDIELGFLGATASAYIQQQTKGHYPAPLAALEVMLGAAGVDVEQACQREAEGFAEVFGTPVNRGLINVFFLQDRNKKDPGVAADAPPAKIESVGVLGAGVMGQGIAAANIKRKLPVALADVSAEALQRGVGGVLEEVSYNKATKGPDARRAIEFAPLLNADAAQSKIVACDLVIEAVVENPAVKQEVLSKLEPRLKETAILASNTSTIPITQLASKLKAPERFCGIHFFNPVRSMPLVEVIRGEKTSDQTIATAVAYAKRIGKSPIVVKDGPGFLVNRLLFPYMNESLELLLDGASVASVERAAKSFGMPMGPITLFDVVGIDVALFAGKVMHEAFPDRVVTSPILEDLYQAGRLGQKAGRGFFAYKDKKGKGTPDPAAGEIIAKHSRGGSEQFSTEQLMMRLFLPMLLEATRALEEGVVRAPQDVDLGLIYGIGFPPFKGGLLFWADTLGAAQIMELLKPYESLGARYEPTTLLREMAQHGETFYKQSNE